jgi:glycine oxidase
LRLKARPSTLQITTTIRAIVNGRSCYLVPRSQGELVLGATSVERGYDLAVKAGEVHQLLDDARVVFPSIDEYEIIDAEVGLRPTTLDHHPIVEDLGGGLIVALGHYRNGFLLAPSTARRVIELLKKP